MEYQTSWLLYSWFYSKVVATISRYSNGWDGAKGQGMHCFICLPIINSAAEVKKAVCVAPWNNEALEVAGQCIYIKVIDCVCVVQLTIFSSVSARLVSMWRKGSLHCGNKNQDRCVIRQIKWSHVYLVWTFSPACALLLCLLHYKIK